VLRAKGETVAQMRCRQSGKSFTIDGTIQFINIFWKSFRKNMGFTHLTEDFHGIYFGPQQEQVKTNFDRVKKMLKELIDNGNPYDLRFEEANGNTLKLSNGNIIYCFSLSPTSNTESKTSNCNIYEEAQNLEDVKIDNTADPMLASTAGARIFNGTAGYRLCKFYKVLNNPDIPKHIYNHARVIKERKDAYEQDGKEWHLNYEKHIETKILDLGYESDAFQTQYALNWMLERGMFIMRERLLSLQSKDVPLIIPKKHCRKCAEKDSVRAQSLEHDQLWEEYVDVGIDWGKAHDRTVVTVKDRSKKWIISWSNYTGDDYPSQIDMIKEFLQH